MSQAIGIVRPEEAETIWVLGDRMRFMGSVAGTDLHVMELLVPPGSGTPPHRHPSIEIFRVTDGEITFGIFGEGPPREVVAGPGSIVTVPSGAGHNYTNRGAAPAGMTVIVQRQMHDFFREIGTAAAPPPGPPPEAAVARVMAVCARHGVEILPPA
jgi:quercetin dioxygenase-like cupin family protein